MKTWSINGGFLSCGVVFLAENVKISVDGVVWSWECTRQSPHKLSKEGGFGHQPPFTFPPFFSEQARCAASLPSLALRVGQTPSGIVLSSFLGWCVTAALTGTASTARGMAVAAQAKIAKMKVIVTRWDWSSQSPVSLSASASLLKWDKRQEIVRIRRKRLLLPLLKLTKVPCLLGIPM